MGLLSRLKGEGNDAKSGANASGIKKASKGIGIFSVWQAGKMRTRLPKANRDFDRRASARLGSLEEMSKLHDPEQARMALEVERNSARILYELNEEAEKLRAEALALRAQYNAGKQGHPLDIKIPEPPAKDPKGSSPVKSPKKSSNRDALFAESSRGSLGSEARPSTGGTSMAADEAEAFAWDLLGDLTPTAEEKCNVLIVFNPATGRKAAEAIAGPLRELAGHIRLLPSPEEEERMAPSLKEEDSWRKRLILAAMKGAKTAVIVVASAGFLDLRSFSREALFASRRAGRLLNVLHDVTSCDFPVVAEQPVEIRPIFEAPHTKFVGRYAEFDSEVLWAAIQASRSLETKKKKAPGGGAGEVALSPRTPKTPKTPGSRASGDGAAQLSAVTKMKLFADAKKLLRDQGYAYRCYLSYKRGDGEYIARKIKAALTGYRTFLDLDDGKSEEFDAGELQREELNMVVKAVHTLIIYMSEGWVESELCLGEFKSAVDSIPRRRIVIVCDLRYALPHDFAAQRKFRHTCRDRMGGVSLYSEALERAWKDRIAYGDEYIAPCMHRLTSFLGVPDAVAEYLRKHCTLPVESNARNGPGQGGRAGPGGLQGTLITPRALNEKKDIVKARNEKSLVFQLLSGLQGVEALLDGELNISGHACSDRESHAVIRLVGESQSLLKADLGWCDLHDYDLVLLFNGLRTNRLSVMRNHVTARVAQAVGTALAVPWCQLRALDLSEGIFGPGGLKLICDGLYDNTSLKHLVLMQVTGASRHKKAANASQMLSDLSKVLSHNQGLLQLDFVDVNLHRECPGGVEEMASDMAIWPKMRNLDLSLNPGLGAGRATLDPLMSKLGEGLSANKALRRLSMNCCNVGDAGMAALARGLAGNHALHEVYLRWNCIGNKGASAIGDMLKRNTSLEILDVSDNDISFLGARALAGGLWRNKTLAMLLMKENEVGKWGHWALKKAFESHPKLNSLSLTPLGRFTAANVKRRGERAEIAFEEHRKWVHHVFSVRAVETPPVRNDLEERRHLLVAEAEDRRLEVISLKHEVNGLLKAGGGRAKYDINVVPKEVRHSDAELVETRDSLDLDLANAIDQIQANAIEDAKTGLAGGELPKSYQVGRPSTAPKGEEEAAAAEVAVRAAEAEAEAKAKRLKPVPSIVDHIVPTGQPLVDTEDLAVDYLVVHHPQSGVFHAQQLAIGMIKLEAGTTVGVLPGVQEWGEADVSSIEDSVYAARQAVVVLISWGSLVEATCVMALRAAVKYDKKLVVAYAPESCPFPGWKEQPRDLWGVFTSFKPAPFILMYCDFDSYRILEMAKSAPRPSEAMAPPKALSTIREEAPRPLKACGLVLRALICAFRSTGYFPAFRMRMELSNTYNVLLSCESQLDDDTLVKLAASSHTLVLYLSEGILDVEGCVRQLEAAVQAKRRVVITHDVGYHLPVDFSVQPVFAQHAGEMAATVLRAAWLKRIPYEPEHFEPCIEEVEDALGLSDYVIQALFDDEDMSMSDAAREMPPEVRIMTMMSGVSGYAKVAGDAVRWALDAPMNMREAKGFQSVMGDRCPFRAADLTKARVGEETGLVVFEHLDDNAVLEDLRMEESQVGPEVAEVIGKALAQHDSVLRVLRLGGNPLGDAGAKGLAASLGGNRHLTDLSIARCMVYSRGCVALGHALETNSGLTRLDMSGNPVGDDGAQALCKGLTLGAATTRLRILEIGDIGLMHTGARYVGDMLAGNSTIQSLSLRGNTILGPSGGRSIAEGLADNTTLRQLDMIACGLRAGTGMGLKTMLQNNSTIERLWLSENTIPDDGYNMIMEGLAENTGLVLLDLHGSYPGQLSAAALGISLRTNRTLRSLNIRGGSLTQANIARVAAGLRSNRTLLHLEYTPRADGEVSRPVTSESDGRPRESRMSDEFLDAPQNNPNTAAEGEDPVGYVRSALEKAVAGALGANRLLYVTAPEQVAERAQLDPEVTAPVEELKDQVRQHMDDVVGAPRGAAVAGGHTPAARTPRETRTPMAQMKKLFSRNSQEPGEAPEGEEEGAAPAEGG